MATDLPISGLPTVASILGTDAFTSVRSSDPAGTKNKNNPASQIKTFINAPGDVSIVVGTSLLYGGELTINADPTKFDIAAGSARFVDNYTDPENPTESTITWITQTAVVVTGIAGQFATFVGVNSSGVFIQNGTGFSPSDERAIVTLGLLAHVNLTDINSAKSFGNWGRDTKLDIADLLSATGPRYSLGGNEFRANGTNLNLDKTAGSSFGMGINYANDRQNPNISADSLQTLITFISIYRTTQFAFTTTVPNDKYDPIGAGALVDIPDGYFVTHRVFFDTSTGTVALQYSQYAYDSLKKASTSWEQEDFVLDPALSNAILRTVIVIKKGCSALNDPDCTKLIQLGLFGDRTLNIIESFSRFAESIEVIDGMSYQRQALTFLGGAIEVAAEFNFESDDISFVNSDSSINTIAEDFTNSNLQVGNLITVSGSANNNGTFNIVTLAATKITVVETIIDESAGADITIQTPGKGDITFVFGQREFILDCTTGSGTYGKARTLVTLGTDVAPQKNWVYVIRSGEIAILQSSTSEPTGEYAMICTALIPSGLTSTDGGGYYNSRRHTDTKEIEGRGAISTILSKLRDPSSYKSGALVNITIDTGPSPDSVDFTVTPGVFREIYNQNTLAMQLSVDDAILLNDEVTPYLKLSDLNEITTDTTGATLNNRYYQLVVIVGLNADGYPDRLLINKPKGSYLSASAAFEDTSGYSVTTVPDGFTSAYLLCAGVFRLSGGTTITNEALSFGVNNIDLRGQALGVKSSGSGTAAVTHFSDADFRAFSNADDTKEIAFNAGGITTATLRTITMPDYDVTLVTANQTNNWTAVQVFEIGARFAAIGPDIGETVIPIEDAGADISMEFRDATTSPRVVINTDGSTSVFSDGITSEDVAIFDVGLRTPAIAPDLGNSAVIFEDAGQDVDIEIRDAATDMQVHLKTDSASEFNLGIILPTISPLLGDSSVSFSAVGQDVDIQMYDDADDLMVHLKTDAASIFNLGIRTTSIAALAGQNVVLIADAGEDMEIVIADAGDNDKIRLTSNGDSEFNGGDVLFTDLRQTTINESLADDAFIDLTTNTTGWGFVMVGDNEEYAHFRFTSAGVVSLTYDSGANVVTTDTDTKFCIFDNGAAVRIRNRLGAAKDVRAVIHLG